MGVSPCITFPLVKGHTCLSFYVKACTCFSDRGLEDFSVPLSFLSPLQYLLTMEILGYKFWTIKHSGELGGEIFWGYSVLGALGMH